MLWITLIIALLLLVLAVTFLLFRAEDLSHLDKTEHPVLDQLPSDGHEAVLSRLKQMGRATRGLKGRARLLATREHLDHISDDLPLTSDIRPQGDSDAPGSNPLPRGEWVIAPGADTRRRLLYIHGGAWAVGSPRSHRGITDALSNAANAAVFAVDYRLMPEHRYIDGVRDCRDAYRWILENGPDGPEPLAFLVVAGDSAGGSHTLGLLAWARDRGLRPADAAIAFSPSTDLTFTAPSNRGNIATDPLLGPVFGGLSKLPLPVLWWGTLAAFRVSPTHPVASPLRGNLANLPPTLIQASASEMLLDNARRYTARARAAGSPVTLHTWPGMVHVWQLFVDLLPEAREAFEDVRNFLDEVEAKAPARRSA